MTLKEMTKMILSHLSRRKQKNGKVQSNQREHKVTHTEEQREEFQYEQVPSEEPWHSKQTTSSLSDPLTSVSPNVGADKSDFTRVQQQGGAGYDKVATYEQAATYEKATTYQQATMYEKPATYETLATYEKVATYERV